MKSDEFYVGYLPEAPTHIASVIKKSVVAIGGVIVCISLLLAWYQKKFAASNFEYGINTTVEGFLFTEPVPHIAVSLGESFDGKKLYQNILLVGFGKAGAKDVISKIETKTNKQLEGSKVKLSGYLIYGDGKALMQITEEDNDEISISDDPAFRTRDKTSLGNLIVSGEVIDPKCYFGVMKPGEGKAHRSCAIRCIAGGIPPVFHSTGSSEYFLLVNEEFEPVNQNVLPIVGDQLTLSGEAIVLDDWKILKVNTKSIEGIVQKNKLREILLAFNEGITQCK